VIDTLFHPAVARWFASCFTEPTAAQRRGWPAIRSGRHTLIAAPTGSGKTLAAFLASLDGLLRDGLAGRLADELRVVYVSPLKALGNDVHRNLGIPRAGIAAALESLGLPPVDIRTAVRSGDTTAAERAAMIARPPHILVTTPESLYLMLTAARGRRILRTAQTVIVDEIHAILRDRRGAHLALSLERLDRLAGGQLVRVGLSATQRPIEEVARYLVGKAGVDEEGRPSCEIIDEGHRRALDLGIEIPRSPLEAVMSAEVWQEVYGRIGELVGQHRTTLVFVNTRRLAERVARQLGERLGEDAVASHHGSLSKEMRLSAEQRLKEGKLRVVVATASLELGIDIGAVDLVCQIGSTRSIATLLQRVGRSGHHVGGTPKGRLFPLTRDELVECAALLLAVREGGLDAVAVPDKPLDVLAQQMVAEAACQDWREQELFDLLRRAWPYRNLTRAEFDEVVRMLADGFATRRGRRGALLHHDGVNGQLRGRRGARLAAITSGGAIPDNADYRVVLDPAETFIGTVNEDFAIESTAGDIFQLGNASWRILRVEPGLVRVADARGQPPTIPFWLGEAPGRTDELSEVVSRVREEIEARCADPAAAEAWLVTEVGLAPEAAGQIVRYLLEARCMLGALPTRRRLVAERFFDEAGGMQLVVHSPRGSRLNRAWGLALRKRFCRTFNFELQAAANEDAIVLSLGPQHSFPLDEVFDFLRPGTVADVLVQAVLDAPVFATRWRWNATRALAVLRSRGGRRVPTPLLRMESQDLLAAVFPDATGCLENIGGDRDVPDHPLVRQTVFDCLHEAMDVDGLRGLLEAVGLGEVECVARDLPEPSPLAHEILNAKPYAFLDDAPLEERRTQAVLTRRALDASSAADLGALDPAAIARVRDEAWPEVGSDDELHDAMLCAGFLTEAEVAAGRGGRCWRGELDRLVHAGRAGIAAAPGPGLAPLCTTAERLPQIRAVLGAVPPALVAPARERARIWGRAEAVRELLRGRMEISGPITAAALGTPLGLGAAEAEEALVALEAEGAVLRGRFTPGTSDLEWCDRRLLARIHRYTLDRLRAEIDPVSPADYMRFLLCWQHVDPEDRLAGPDGLAAVVEQLDGYPMAAGAWEAQALPARVRDYSPLWLDGLCLAGQVGWARLRPPGPRGPRESNGGARPAAGPVRSTPIAIFLRENAAAWLSGGVPRESLGAGACAVLDALDRRGAMFLAEIASEARLLRTQVETALCELVVGGVVTADGFAGLRSLLVPARPGKRRTRPAMSHGRDAVQAAGRWSLLRRADCAEELGAAAVEAQARALLRRWGVVVRRVIDGEAVAPWRDLDAVLRRFEARGEIRGGRFVSGFSGHQYALPEAVGRLRAVRREGPDGRLILVGGADPLNLTACVTPGERIAAVSGSRVLFRDGVPVAALEAGKRRLLVPTEPAASSRLLEALAPRAPLGPRGARWPHRAHAATAVRA
jgi:ATP-dependent helicase Lhr and Lhr-like helicase